jgi:hypothetical protein
VKVRTPQHLGRVERTISDLKSGQSEQFDRIPL